MARGAKGSSPASFDGVLRLLAWALGVLLVASAFTTLRGDLHRALSWGTCVFSVLSAGIAIGRGRRPAFFAYAAIAVLVNPIAPFQFPHQAWRLIWAAAGLWMIADHLPGRD
jgi:hypothetical protein